VWQDAGSTNALLLLEESRWICEKDTDLAKINTFDKQFFPSTYGHTLCVLVDARAS
jgi:hypothetical protein